MSHGGDEHSGRPGGSREYVGECVETTREFTGRRHRTDVQGIDHLVVGAWSTERISRLKVVRGDGMQSSECLRR